jgi:hypothetical protein
LRDRPSGPGATQCLNGCTRAAAHRYTETGACRANAAIEYSRPRRAIGSGRQEANAAILESAQFGPGKGAIVIPLGSPGHLQSVIRLKSPSICAISMSSKSARRLGLETPENIMKGHVSVYFHLGQALQSASRESTIEGEIFPDFITKCFSCAWRCGAQRLIVSSHELMSIPRHRGGREDSATSGLQSSLPPSAHPMALQKGRRHPWRGSPRRPGRA